MDLAQAIKNKFPNLVVETLDLKGCLAERAFLEKAHS